jgi:hypothetical protein
VPNIKFSLGNAIWSPVLGTKHGCGAWFSQLNVRFRTALVPTPNITDAAAPTSQAMKLTFQYFERNQKLMARHIKVFGGCDVEVTLRDDGFSFEWCPPQGGEPSFSYDPNDPKYPFKSKDANPRKLWLQANE